MPWGEFLLAVVVYVFIQVVHFFLFLLSFWVSVEIDLIIVCVSLHINKGHGKVRGGVVWIRGVEGCQVIPFYGFFEMFVHVVFL